MATNAYLVLSLLLFCLGTVLQFQGGMFGDPYLQQFAVVATWLPVALVALRYYYYSYSPLTPPLPAPADSNATSEPVPPK